MTGCTLIVAVAAALCCAATASARERVILENDRLRVELDARGPVVRWYELVESGARLSGIATDAGDRVPFVPIVTRNDQPVPVDVRLVSIRGDATSRCYKYAGFGESGKVCSFELTLSIRESALVVQLGRVREYSGCEVREIRFNSYRPLCVEAGPNTMLGIDNDLKSIRSAEPQVWHNVPYALIADRGISAGVWCNQTDPGGPLEATIFDAPDSRVSPEGADRMAGIGPQTFHHRVKDRILPDFEMCIGIVADYNDDGEANWLDAANWIGAHIPASIPDFYADAHIYKAFMCANNHVSFSLDQMRERMVQLYNLTNGSPHIIYLVGWQYDGHDSNYPAMDQVNEAIGGREKLVALMRDGSKYNFNFSFHFNFDDAYPASPDWDQSIVAIDDRGEMVKGGVWAGSQSYIVCPYKLVKSGKAARMIDHMLDLYPLRDTVHLDVLSAVPSRISMDKDDPSDEIANLVLGKFEIVRLFNKRGLDVSSEWITYPFIGPITHFWHAGLAKPGNYPITTAILHGRTIYGGWNAGWQGSETGYIPEYLGYGAGMDRDLVYATPISALLDVEFLLDSVKAMYDRRPMTGFARRGSVVRVDYGAGTWVQWNERTHEYEAHVDGRLVSRNYACMVPSSGGTFIVYSRDDSRLSFPLPEALKDKKLNVFQLSADGRRERHPYETARGELTLEATGHVPYLVTAE